MDMPQFVRNRAAVFAQIRRRKKSVVGARAQIREEIRFDCF